LSQRRRRRCEEFCKCDDAAAATCECDVRAYARVLAAREAAWEQEKDEWRQEFQLEKDRALADASGACEGAATPATTPRPTLRAKHAKELRIELDLLQFPERDSATRCRRSTSTTARWVSAPSGTA
jgi:hypothetical protein